MNFRGRRAKRFTENSTENLKKAWAVQRASKKAKEKAELKALKLKLKQEKAMAEKKERPLPMTKEERQQHCQNLLARLGLSREQVEAQVKQVPRIPSNSLVETAYGYKRVREAL